MNDAIQRLEEKIAYLERHVTEQDKAMLELADEVAGLRRQFLALRDRSENRNPSGESGPPDAADDRPPHY